MLVRCWGARGSISVSGREYLRYGGDTPCLEIRTKDDHIVIIDAGTGIRRLGNRLLIEDRHDYTMIFTHVHWDHLMGFPFFRPIYRSGTHIAMFGCPFAQASVREMISRIMTAPYFPVNFEDIKADIRYHETCEEVFQIGGMTITPIPLSHPNQGLGYRFEEDGRSFVYLTDNELSYRHPGGLKYDDYAAFAKGADLLVHDAEYNPGEYRQTRSWGHSVYTDALRLALDAGVGRLGLFHHNQERTDEAVDEMVADCRRIAAGRPLECFALHQDMEIIV
ncbi:MAG: MBL fold metallo-hydrolase [Deltaproteobacteria bacterium]|nr:MBL fold metallo-hydrolase [Deltaproteobacteria bacterium]